MGSTSDWETMEHASNILTGLGVPHETRVVSAHRTPDLLFEYASTAEQRGLEVIIAGAGGAAHLPGMTASKTVLPVLGVPVESKVLKGLDSLLSIAQMPGGVPVGTLAIGKAGAVNAALLAAAILGNKHAAIREALRKFLAERVPVYPPPAALEAAQDRLAEKVLFRSLGINTTDFLPITKAAEFEAAVKELGLPAVLKTSRLGYDGKGQWILRTAEDVAKAKGELPNVALILERFVPFRRELSVLAVRSRKGETAFYPLVENHHRGGILRLSFAPAPGLEPPVQRAAEDIARRVLESLQYVGVLAIEFFEHEGRLLANEMAPRVHNSGHWTIEGAVTSQFENHLRVVLGLPFGVQ